MVPQKVSTPGSYHLEKRKKKKKMRQEKKGQGRIKKKVGRPSGKPKKSSARKDNYRSKYTPEDMVAAVEKVTNEGWTVARAAREHGVPRVTLLDNVKGTHKTGAPGRPTVLSKCEEEVLVSRIVLFGQYNYPVSKRHLRDMVKAYLDKRRDTIFKENRPGKNWVKAFLKRHADQVVVRTPTNIRRSRAAVSPAEIRQYFANLAREVEGVPPMNVFNYDETNFRDDPGASQCIFKKGVRYPEQAWFSTFAGKRI
jgi:transposase-like protein